jgi:pantetheine-phosphate adenylyltransferase
MNKIAIYPGTFDPPTLGHLDLIQRGGKIVDHLIVGIGINSTKKPLFNTEERIDLLKNITSHLDNVEIQSFSGLLMEYASSQGATIIIRGLRAISDFEFELQLAMINRRLNKTIDTIFLMPDERYSYLNSTIVKEVARLKGDISSFVSPVVAEKLIAKFNS